VIQQNIFLQEASYFLSWLTNKWEKRDYNEKTVLRVNFNLYEKSYNNIIYDNLFFPLNWEKSNRQHKKE